MVLWKLQMPMQKKLALSCALGMGIVLVSTHHELEKLTGLIGTRSGCVEIVKATGVPTLASQDVSCE